MAKRKAKAKTAEQMAEIENDRLAAHENVVEFVPEALAAFCLNDKGKIDIGSFTDVLDANGVDHSKWTNRNKGWEGRFRMTGRVALQRIVATSGVLKWPGEQEPSEAPADWIEKYKAK